MIRLATLLLAVAALVAGVAALLEHRSSPASAGAQDDSGLTVARTVLRPGHIELALHNGGSTSARIAQVIVNDAYVDFRARRARIGGRQSGWIAIDYPWVRGESYEIEVLTSLGIVEGEIERAGEEGANA